MGSPRSAGDDSLSVRFLAWRERVPFLEFDLATPALTPGRTSLDRVLTRRTFARGNDRVRDAMPATSATCGSDALIPSQRTKCTQAQT